jgi:hypothetical protein
MKKLLMGLALIIGTTAMANIKSAHLFWLMEQPELKLALKDQFVLKTFYQPTECRAAHCFDFVVCGLKKEPSGSVQFFVHRVGGESFYFNTRAIVRSEVYADLPVMCDGD